MRNNNLVSLGEVFKNLKPTLKPVILDQEELRSVCSAVRAVLTAMFPSGGIANYDEFLTAPKTFFTNQNGNCTMNPLTKAIAAPNLTTDYIPKHLLKLREVTKATADLIRYILRTNAGTNAPFIGPEIPLELINGADGIGINELHEYCRRLRENDRPDEAKARLILAFMPLANRVATHYKLKDGLQGIDVAGLENDGIQGILDGAKGFEPERGIKLNTYMYYWIRSCVQRAFEKRRKTIGISEDRTQKISHEAKIRTRFYAQYGRDPNKTELAALLECDDAQLEVNKTASACGMVISFETPLKGSRDKTLGQQIATSHSCEDHEHTDTMGLLRIQEGIKAVLTGRERHIFYLAIERGIPVRTLSRTELKDEGSRETLNQKVHLIKIKLRAYAYGVPIRRIMAIKLDDLASMRRAEAELYASISPRVSAIPL